MNAAPTTPAIDIIVPVYNAPDDVRRCVDSVLRHTPGDYRLLLIDDASPDPRIAAYFEEIGQINPPRVLLMRNGRNLGFTATVNRGIAASHADVVLLNSDTIVTAGWLDALARCAGSSLRIATVTPFSNNAEIASFPRFCENNQWPEDADAEAVRAALADAAVPTYPDLPTGVGFCMFVRRSALDELGPFDMAFGRVTARKTTSAFVQPLPGGATCSPTTRLSSTLEVSPLWDARRSSAPAIPNC